MSLDSRPGQGGSCRADRNHTDLRAAGRGADPTHRQHPSSEDPGCVDWAYQQLEGKKLSLRLRAGGPASPMWKGHLGHRVCSRPPRCTLTRVHCGGSSTQASHAQFSSRSRAPTVGSSRLPPLLQTENGAPLGLQPVGMNFDQQYAIPLESKKGLL